MINLGDPLAVLATRLPWTQLEAAIAAKFARSARAGAVVDTVDLFGPSQTLMGASLSPAGRPRLPLRRMISGGLQHPVVAARHRPSGPGAGFLRLLRQWLGAVQIACASRSDHHCAQALA